MARRVVYGVGDEFMQREGLQPLPEPWEDGRRSGGNKGAFEWWYFDAHLDDGSTAVIVFADKPMLERQGGLAPNLSLTITRPDGRKVSRFWLYPPEQYGSATERCDVRIGPSWVRGDLHQYQVHADGQDLGAELVFTGIVPPWRPGTGKSYFDDRLTRYFGWLPAIPYGRVEGTLTYDGQTHYVQGDGYHDHNWGNIGLNEVLSQWYWGRAHVGDWSLIFVQMTASPAYGGQQIPVFLLAKGERILIGDGTPLTLETSDWARHEGGRKYPRQSIWRWQGPEGNVLLSVRRPELIEATSLLLLLPTWQRRIVRLFANPYYLRFNADLDLTVELAGVHTHEMGKALYEIMMLR